MGKRSDGIFRAREGAFAVAKIRATRDAVRRQTLVLLKGLGLVVGLPLVMFVGGVVLLSAAIEFLPAPGRMPGSVILLIGLPGAAGGLGFFVSLFSVGSLLISELPSLTWRAILSAVTRKTQRRMVEDLGRHGRVFLSDYPGSWRTRQAVARLEELNPHLESASGALEPVVHKPTGLCPRCHSDLEHQEAGGQTCPECGYSRSGDLPEWTPAFQRHRGVLVSLLEWHDPLLPDEATIFRHYRDAQAPRLRTVFRWSAMSLTVLFVVFVALDLIVWLGDSQTLRYYLRDNIVPAMMLVIPELIGMGWVLGRWTRLRVVRFGPVYSKFEQAALREILFLVEQHGGTGLDALAGHLTVTKEHLNRLLDSLFEAGGMPLSVDASTGRLVG